MVEPPSSPPSEATGAEDALSWYKAQYELLEGELAEFRDSSRELEQELEKDIDRAEKQERVLQEKAETLGFEVQEWKVHLPLVPPWTRPEETLADSLRRESTKSPRPRPARRRTGSKRRLRFFATQTGRCSSGCGTLRWPTTTLSVRPATRRRRSRTWSQSTTRPLSAPS